MAQISQSTTRLSAPVQRLRAPPIFTFTVLLTISYNRLGDAWRNATAFSPDEHLDHLYSRARKTLTSENVEGPQSRKRLRPFNQVSM
ncbi:hypothetical protein [Desulfohalobium retbaense]|uniref:hypothetical protein n=1 Tax=Desulfohalobium retbaense TaxID=45663 RepID=UPI000321D29A|nr:hypothetical protein [Desulfohalobium retbaense]